jgi:hypothetical protein
MITAMVRSGCLVYGSSLHELAQFLFSKGPVLEGLAATSQFETLTRVLDELRLRGKESSVGHRHNIEDYRKALGRNSQNIENVVENHESVNRPLVAEGAGPSLSASKASKSLSSFGRFQQRQSWTSGGNNEVGGTKELREWH